MKKTALAVFVTGALGVSAANAATVTEFANGVLVPSVISSETDATIGQTAVGLTSCAEGTVYWTFFDVNSRHILDDQFDMTENDQANLVWNQSPEFGGTGTDGLQGYAVFILDTTEDGRLSANPTDAASSDAPCLAGAAFQVYAVEDDVAFIPTMPLNVRPFVEGGPVGDFDPVNPPDPVDTANGTVVFIDDLLSMDENTVARLTAGANANDEIYLRYFLDDATTDIYIWSTSRPSPSGAANDPTTVQMFDDEQNRRSLNFDFDNTELNIIDPAGIIGLPADFVDGFIQWTVPPRDIGVITWSLISSSENAFNARQTVVNPIRLLDANGDSAFRLRVSDVDAVTVTSEAD
jgi:hypothetical protein